MTTTTKRRTVYGRGHYRDAAAKLLARVCTDGTLIITRDAFRRAEGRVTYAGEDAMHLQPVEGYTDWAQASGGHHGRSADGCTIPAGDWYCRPI